MKAMVLEKYGEGLKLRDVAVPAPASDEVLLKVMATGVCATDLKLATGKFSSLSLPVIPGHEIAGKIAKVGEKVKGFRVGDRVVAYIYTGCGTCKNCRSGRISICTGNVKRFGLEINGGFAEYMISPAANLLVIPEKLSYTEASIVTDAVATCVHALEDHIHLQKGDNILILGAGGLGMHALQIAKHLGAIVTVADISDEKLKTAAKYGADHVINNSKVDLVKECKKITDGYGMDYTGDFVGLPEVSRLGLESLCYGGTMVLVGYSFGTPFGVDSSFMMSGERSIKGSRAMTKANVAEGLRLLAEGTVIPQIGLTNSLEKINDVLKDLASGNINGRAVLIADADSAQ
jgi:2-desacetyl-2-hydroxyethyl bacteriochlorophyllide A dehydrogenase